MYGPQYGQLTPWDKEKAEQGDILGFPRAIFVIAAQDFLFGLLRNIVSQILEGIELNNPQGSLEWDASAIRGFRQINFTEYQYSYLSQAFSAPPVLNIGKVLEIVDSKVNELADDLWLLQTDPTYMRHTVTDIGHAWISEADSRMTYSKFCASELYSEAKSL